MSYFFCTMKYSMMRVILVPQTAHLIWNQTKVPLSAVFFNFG